MLLHRKAQRLKHWSPWYFVQLIFPLSFTHLCQFSCSTLSVEAPCIRVLALLPSSKVRAASINLKKPSLLKRPVRKGTWQFWQITVKTLISRSGIICSHSLSIGKSCCLSLFVHSCQARIFNPWFFTWLTVWLKQGWAVAAFRDPINAYWLLISFLPSSWGTQKFCCN